jgi:hypothetical protein
VALKHIAASTWAYVGIRSLHATLPLGKSASIFRFDNGFSAVRIGAMWIGISGQRRQNREDAASTDATARPKTASEVTSTTQIVFTHSRVTARHGVGNAVGTPVDQDDEYESRPKSPSKARADESRSVAVDNRSGHCRYYGVFYSAYIACSKESRTH